MTISPWDHPVVQAWYKDTLHMVAQAQLAENIVAMIDQRPPRRATIEVENTDTIKITYVDRATTGDTP